MHCPLVSCKISLWRKFMAALSARVFDSYVYCSLVFSKSCIWCILIPALSTRVFDSFMNKIRGLWASLLTVGCFPYMHKIIMSFQHIFRWFNMLTFLTRKHVCMISTNEWLNKVLGTAKKGKFYLIHTNLTFTCKKKSGIQRDKETVKIWNILLRFYRMSKKTDDDIVLAILKECSPIYFCRVLLPRVFGQK